MPTNFNNHLQSFLTFLDDCREYFDRRADADYNGERYVPNTEMRLMQETDELAAWVRNLLAQEGELYKKLHAAFPHLWKEEEQAWQAWKQSVDSSHLRLPTLDPARRAADSFASLLAHSLPADQQELRDLLWVFGKVLIGESERLLNAQQEQLARLSACMVTPLTISPNETLTITEAPAPPAAALASPAASSTGKGYSPSR